MTVVRIYQSGVQPDAGSPVVQADAGSFGGRTAAALGGIEDRAIGDMQRRRSENARTSAGVKLAQLSADSAEAVNAARANAQPDGSGHRDSVLVEFDKRAEVATADIGDRETQNWARVQLAQERARLQVQEGGWEAGRRTEAMVGNVTKAVDLSRAALFAAPSPDALVQQLQLQDGVIDALALSDADKDKLRTETREKLGLAYAQGRAERDPYALRSEIEGGFYTGLVDPDRLAALHNRADTEIRGREAAKRQAEAEQRREQRDAERERRDADRDYRAAVTENVRAAADGLRDGMTISPKELGTLTTAALRAGNPALARTVQNLGIKSLTVQGLRGQPPAAVQAYINDLSGRIAKGAQPDELVSRDAAEDYLTGLKRDLANDPLSRAARDGVVTVAPLDFAKPESIAARVQAARTVASRYGAPLRVLTDEEAGSVAQRLAGPAAQAIETMTAMRGLGKDAAFAVAAQIAPKDPAMAQTVALAFLPGGAGRQNAADIHTGSDIVKANAKIIDTKRAAAARGDVIADALRLRPQLANVVAPIADAIYAARWTRAGNAEWNDDAYGSAVNAALGAYRDGGGTLRGGIGRDRAKGATLLPSNVSQDEFDTALDALDDTKLASTKALAPVDARGRPVPADTIKRGRLLPVGDGRYHVLAKDGGMIAAAGGGLFTLRIAAKGAGQ